MFRKYKRVLILSSIVILLPILFGLFLWDVLPAQITTHWSLRGEADGWSSKPFTIFVLPVILFIFHWICAFGIVLDPKNKEQSKKVFHLVLWIMPAISLVTFAFTYTIALGRSIPIDMLTRILFALILLVLGNYLPKCKQNYTIGMRIPWTLRSEENWSKSHRFLGKLWVVGGLFLLATLFIPLQSITPAIILLFILMLLLPVLYSYVYYRKQLAAGTAVQETAKQTPVPKSRTAFTVTFVTLILLLVVLLFVNGGFELTYNDASLTIDATYWNDMEVNYADIDGIEYCEMGNPGNRTFGYGTPSLVMGQCESNTFGSYTGYFHPSCHVWVVLDVKGAILAINGRDEAETKAIYETLKLKIEQ